jgi:uncharacterized protein (TIGR00369 family)
MTDPDFPALAAQIRHFVGAQGFMRLLGAEIDQLEPGLCVMSVARRPDLLQQDGLFHGGVTAFLVDNATTTAAATRRQLDQRVLTAEYKLNLMAPARGQRLICRASLLKPGRMAVVEARVFSREEDEDKLTAVALATIAMLPGPVRQG